MKRSGWDLSTGSPFRGIGAMLLLTHPNPFENGTERNGMEQRQPNQSGGGEGGCE
eukprot:CAMPEP_0198235712 /NCGR_PEP_ID=MMETSP1446-20131203/1612_1 /TAXON_ID=1461542 ORGANISM="Unidentified sp, Strain CCMP2111" /NCGR_SAMPLE_ID=MMETSP1446 /ASSEMBLY_ACC=CAM_ASM_001112 /LENGTH=54 /DNA_ID=CAMNT_0043917055 /DNA_START=87 /DNA_END=248 /DNA_ORIENTATION=-